LSSHRIAAVPPPPRPAGLAPMELVEGAGAIAERYPANLADESRASGRADALAFPLCEADVAEAVRRAAAAGMPVTAASGRTGIAAGCVPDGGMLISLERMTALAIEEGARGQGPGASPETARNPQPATRNQFTARCGPGLSLKDLGAALARHAPPLFLPPNPTETTAQVGGAVAANASGARSYRWGALRRYVAALRVVLSSGDVLALRRGQCLAGPGGFEIILPGGRTLGVPVPGYRMPAVKNAAGYYAAPGMDLVDLFVGSEGTLGIVTEATLAVEPEPESTVAIQGFFPDEPRALEFVRAVRGAGLQVQAIEYFDGGSLQLLAEKRAGDGPGSEVPETPAGAGAAVLVEVSGDAAGTEAALEELCGLLAAHGADPEVAWAGLDERERARLAAFRHALPEAVNSLIGRTRAAHPGLTKVGTDMAVPAESLGVLLAAYREKLGGAGLRHVIFGHIGDSHLHANVLPRDMAEYERAKALYLELAALAVRLGGTISAEHGVGKLKKKLLALMYGPEGIAGMRRARLALDPQGLFGRGTMFD